MTHFQVMLSLVQCNYDIHIRFHITTGQAVSSTSIYPLSPCDAYIQYIPRNMHTVFALLCFVVVIHWLIFPYPPGLLHWHCGNLTIASVPAKQPWWIWINTSWEFIMNDCITTTKQSATKPCAYFWGYTVPQWTEQCWNKGNIFLTSSQLGVRVMAFRLVDGMFVSIPSAN